MPFNLCDKDGKNIGFIARRYPGNFHEQIYLAGLSQRRLQDSGLDMKKVFNRLATTHDCKNMLGRINESKLNDLMEQKWLQEKGGLGDIGFDAFVKLAYLFNEYDISLDIPEEDIGGFILLDLKKATFLRDTILVEDELDYLEEPVIPGEKPLYVKIIEHPVMKIDVMGMEGLFFGGGLADLGGRNHTHETRLKIKSGNCEKEITFPIPFHAVKGKTLQLYFKDGKLTKVFCDFFYAMN